MAVQVYTKVLSSTQAGGAVQGALAPSGHSAPGMYSLQVGVTSTATGYPAVASAGTLSVKARVPGASGFQELGVVDLAALEPVLFEGFYSDVQAVSTGFDADKTWTMVLVSGG